MCWKLKLEQFGYTVKYKKGVNKNSEASSRIKLPNVPTVEVNAIEDDDLQSVLPDIDSSDLDMNLQDLEDIIQDCENPADPEKSNPTSVEQPNESNHSSTIHSQEENQITEIPYTKKSVNCAKQQIILYQPQKV
ncbi:hypothetical protein HHI36_001288 [Cryptolaemus montrouzieri]|uniref:Uncharacterized protein n=1 Tax=Cryptolaemus montrouzieri TaxID=559131 RepID=A0ABD2P7J2_9CUCU